MTRRMMSNLGDLLDDYEPERLAKLAADDLITKARREAMSQEVRDRVDGVNAMIDEDEDAYSCNECKKLFHMESLVVQAHDDGRPMEGFMCRPCHEASGKKEWWV